jgi:hypothetical protein
MAGLQQDDRVVFAGPPGDALNWPVPGERGVIQRAGRDAVQVMWERSPLVMVWPAEWIEREQTHLGDPGEA